MGGKHVLVDDGPRVKKDNFDVEQDKEHGDEVEFHGHAAGTLALGQHAALVGGILGGGETVCAPAKPFAKNNRQQQITGSKRNGHQQQDKHRKILFHLAVHGKRVGEAQALSKVKGDLPCLLPVEVFKMLFSR